MTIRIAKAKLGGYHQVYPMDGSYRPGTWEWIRYINDGFAVKPLPERRKPV